MDQPDRHRHHGDLALSRADRDTDMEPFKLGFIGAGSIARSLGKALRQVRGARIAGVFSPNSAPGFAGWVDEQGLGPCRAVGDVAELCELCDAVAILAPNYVRVEHVGQIVSAVEKGAELRGVICEKPLARTVAEGRQLVEMVRSAGLKTAYFENQIHMKAVKNALAQLAPAQSAMGPLSLARSSEEHAGPHNPWFWDPVRQGGGVLSDMGCHSIAVSWYALTPVGKPTDFLEPVSVIADTSLLKWGRPEQRKRLLEQMGVDYEKTPAEDFATGVITFRNPETGQIAKAQFTNSWMYDKQGLRLYIDGLGPGYAFEIDSLRSPLQVFIGDAAAGPVADAEQALENATASRGLLTVQPNEADLYGYTDELEDAIAAFGSGRDALLSWEYGLEITRLCQAGYLSAEQGRALDLTDPEVQKQLDGYTSLIAQGKGAEILYR